MSVPPLALTSFDVYFRKGMHWNAQSSHGLGTLLEDLNLFALNVINFNYNKLAATSSVIAFSSGNDCLLVYP